MRFLAFALLSSAFFLNFSNGFYLSEVGAPHDYIRGEDVPLKVNKLTSSKTEVAYEYYELPFCKPEKIMHAAENIGEALAGNAIENSPYQIKFLVEEQCKLLCRQVYSYFQARKFVSKIEEYYVINWIVDNLPSAWRWPIDDGQDIEYYQGFPLGGTIVDVISGDTITHFLNNHHRIIIKFNLHESGTWSQNQVSGPQWEGNFDPNIIRAKIVGLDVEPFSVKHTYEGKWDDASPPSLRSCLNLRHESTKDYIMSLDGFSEDQVDAEDTKTIKKSKRGRNLGSLEVIWTYDVIWEESDVRWATRWDVYLNANAKQDEKVHWLTIVKSPLIVLFSSGMVAVILMSVAVHFRNTKGRRDQDNRTHLLVI